MNPGEKAIREEIEKRKKCREEDDGSDAPEARANRKRADFSRMSISEVARRCTRTRSEAMGVGMTKAGVGQYFKVCISTSNRASRHFSVFDEEDPMDTMSAVSSSYTAESLEEFMYMVRMVDYTDALLAMGIGGTLDDIAATVVSRGLRERGLYAVQQAWRNRSIRIFGAEEIPT